MLQEAYYWKYNFYDFVKLKLKDDFFGPVAEGIESTLEPRGLKRCWSVPQILCETMIKNQHDLILGTAEQPT